MRVKTYDLDDNRDKKLKFAVIIAKVENDWLFVKHKERETWEITGGKRESGEFIEHTAKRELMEETGAEDFKIIPVFDYSVEIEDKLSYGRVFYSEVYKLGVLPNLEIGEIKTFKNLPKELTYSKIQPILFEKALEILNKKKL